MLLLYGLLNSTLISTNVIPDLQLKLLEGKQKLLSTVLLVAIPADGQHSTNFSQNIIPSH